ncbi:MAG: hypothetical protein AAF587_29825 [Bacteroidota bacterium]
MSVLLWIVGIFLGGYVMIRLFGRQLLMFGLKRLSRKMMSQIQDESLEYERNYADSNRNNVYVDDSIKVSAPKNPVKKEIKEDEIAEDIDFEDLDS